jgi:hypothetical protein
MKVPDIVSDAIAMLYLLRESRNPHLGVAELLNPLSFNSPPKPASKQGILVTVVVGKAPGGRVRSLICIDQKKGALFRVPEFWGW